ncbi:hypothetical protein EIP91_007015 [Steccherinum ochraceum]|uniref:F-box domain-containing protein n=1 Tax=Steccherinum ochraceum TaxID=92696 RepID=A0A4R0RQW0_9APHY|nr:hypothetical protein EIP91_007015 [Steccherinum ochraceum]
MHRCLHVYDVVIAIVKHLSLMDRRSVGKDVQAVQTIHSMTLTCSVLYEPAMDVLWSSLLDLTPIVKSLPPHLWFEAEKQVEESADCVSLLRTVRLQAPPQPSDWARAVRNAARVKSIQWNFRRWNRGFEVRWALGDSAMHALALYSSENSRPLLSNLCKYEWYWEGLDPQYFPYIPSLCSDKLESLTIIAHTSLPTASVLPFAHAAFGVLIARCPKMRELLLYQTSYDDDTLVDLEDKVYASFFTEVAKLPCLQSFESHHPLSPSELLLFGRLPRLRNVAMTLYCDADEGLLSTLSSRSLFPELQSLDIEHDNLPTMIQIVEAIASFSLSKLTVSGIPPETPAAQLALLFQTLLPHKYLSYLAVGGTREHLDPGLALRLSLSHLYTVQCEDFRPLLSLHHLTEVFISPQSFALKLDDAMLEAMAQAWPRLQILDIASRLPMHTAPGVTLGGLLPLSVHCRRLVMVYIAVDVVPPSKEARDRLEEEVKRKRPPCHLSMLTIHYGADVDSPEPVLREMADFLTDMFPHLQDFDTSHCLPQRRDQRLDDEEDDIRQHWERFKEVVSEYCAS